jgi:hypothetical protein
VTLAGGGVVLVVASARAGSGEPYRGGYVLSATSASGKADGRLLAPHADVEP